MNLEEYVFYKKRKAWCEKELSSGLYPLVDVEWFTRELNYCNKVLKFYGGLYY